MSRQNTTRSLPGQSVSQPADFTPIRSEEALAAAIVSQSDDAVYSVTFDGIVRSWNGGAERLYGFRAAEMIGRRLFGIIPPYYRADFDTNLERVKAGESVKNFETVRMDRQSNRLIISQSMFPIRDATDQIVAAVMVARDETERRAAERALREAADRENFLNRVGQAVRGSADTRQIRGIAAAAAGQMLRADRSFFVVYDFPNHTAQVEMDWKREDLPSLNGTYMTDDNSELYVLLGGGRTLVIEDIREDPRFAAVAERHVAAGMLSAIRVPILADDQLVGTMVVTMAQEARHWTAEDVRFVESVAAQARVALEAARVLLRQEQIATTLQEALQPPLPAFAPGLALASHYRAALEESSVGGDFFDGFPIGPQKTALVIGDLSGKGLQAAAQLAAVRNMLRAMLAVVHPLSEAFEKLNTTLIQQETLRGFVTLFAGIYDAGRGVMTYISAGHEPVLLYHAATKRVEELYPTGSVLGINSGFAFFEAEVSLTPGDILVLYTDGISEAGLNRQTMLGMRGLSDIIRRHADIQNVREFVRHLIDDVDTFAGRALRDDACLVAARILETPAERVPA